jgi:thiol-disulfide isomerase/thioredoxin
MWIIKNVLRRQDRCYVCLIALFAVISAPGLSTVRAAENLKDFKAFSFIDNREINTADMRGNILVMVFGSIYCKPCVELLPVMKMLHERYAHSDVRIILLDIDMAVSPALQREFVERHAITEPYINNALQIARDNKVYMLPTTLIVDRNGEIVQRIHGFKKLEKFDSIIKKLRPSIAGPESPEKVVGSDNATMHGSSASPETVENPAIVESPAPHAHHP